MEAQTKMARHWPPAPIEVSRGSFPNYQIKGIICVTQGSLPAEHPPPHKPCGHRACMTFCPGAREAGSLQI